MTRLTGQSLAFRQEDGHADPLERLKLPPHLAEVQLAVPGRRAYICRTSVGHSTGTRNTARRPDTDQRGQQQAPPLAARSRITPGPTMLEAGCFDENMKPSMPWRPW